MAIRRFDASVSYQDADGTQKEEQIPVHAASYDEANRLVLLYVLEVLKLREFELRVVGS